MAEALVPLLGSGSWVIQGRTCGALTLLLRQELLAQQARRVAHHVVLVVPGIAGLEDLPSRDEALAIHAEESFRSPV